MRTPASISDLVVATAVKLGFHAPTDIIQTILLKDGHFVGHKLNFVGGFALVRADGSSIEFYDEEQQLLHSIAPQDGKEVAA